MRKLWNICPNSFPHHGPLDSCHFSSGFAVWVPMRFQLQNVYPRRWESLGCSVSVNSWLSKDEGISFCREMWSLKHWIWLLFNSVGSSDGAGFYEGSWRLEMQENQNLGLSCTAWFLAILVRILWKAQAQEIRWWATRALSAMWVCERVSRVSLQFSLQIRVEWYDERNCSICFRIRLEKKVAYLELGLMDCSLTIKSSCIKRTTEQSDKLHKFHDSDVRSTGGKLYTSPVLHRSCPRFFSNRVVANG